MSGNEEKLREYLKLVTADLRGVDSHGVARLLPPEEAQFLLAEAPSLQGAQQLAEAEAALLPEPCPEPWQTKRAKRCWRTARD